MHRHALGHKVQVLDRLWSYQNSGGYISDQDLISCAKSLHMSKIELEGVCSFYHFFHRKPSGKIAIYLNDSIVARFKGFQEVKESFQRETGEYFNVLNANAHFGLFTTSCIGLSDQEPAALINFHPFTNLHPGKVEHIISALRNGVEPAAICDQVPDHLRYLPGEGKAIFFRHYQEGAVVTKLQRFSPSGIIKELSTTKLAGMGGAFFPAALKWEACARQPGRTKYIVCNADEGEPGTFKDRVLMNALPGLLLEGMIAAAYAVGASQGFIYLRAEYKWMQSKLEAGIQRFRDLGYLGTTVSNIPGFNFDIQIQLGAGAYVCGEETAMLNSMEGKRGEPRTRRYYPTEKGFLEQPTVVNNVETLCAAARILEMGTAAYLNSGTPTSPGTKLLSISGDCQRPGIYEIEWGMTIAELMDLCQAADPLLIQLSGPSGQTLSMEDKNRVISMEDLRAGGSVMIFNSQRDILEILNNFIDFFKRESCGVCTPCRAGNFIISKKLQKVAAGLAQPADLADLRQWDRILKMTSRCGLGKTSSNAIIDALEKFPEYFKSKLRSEGQSLFEGFDLDQVIGKY